VHEYGSRGGGGGCIRTEAAGMQQHPWTGRDSNLDTWGARDEGTIKGERERNRPTGLPTYSVCIASVQNALL
jgi:hypothetical protein